MVTVVLTLRLDLPGAQSLKDKRRVLKSMMTRMRNDFNISMAEVDLNDHPRHALIGAAVISNSGQFGQQVMAKVIDRVTANPELMVIDVQVESF
ncbi:MAG TPA: DUF503 domain-containing protein [candidate division Zixibacteria bacterium]|nr:DUF503 domain-containing protein [candidate division Zixibacteria bacterium]